MQKKFLLNSNIAISSNHGIILLLKPPYKTQIKLIKKEAKMTSSRVEEKSLLPFSEKRQKNISDRKNTHKNSDHLSKLPNDILQHSLFKFLGSSCTLLGKTSHRFAQLPKFKNEEIEFKSDLNQLLWFVARGKKREVELMLSQHPELLLYKGMTSDYSHRKLEGTALQIALGAEDVDLFTRKDIDYFTIKGNTFFRKTRRKTSDGMAEMIQKYLRKLPDGEEIIKKQIRAQFPEGWEIEEEQKNQRDLAALKKMFKAIEDAKTDHDCKTALQEFRNYLEPKDIIKTGLHFNSNLLIQAVKLRDQYLEAKPFEDYDSAKNIIIRNEIIGYIQRFVPANVGMAIAQGLDHSILVNQFKRSHKFEWIYNFREQYPNLHLTLPLKLTSYFPLSSPGFALGYDTFVVDGCNIYVEKNFTAYDKQKKLTLHNILQQYCDNSKRWCVIL